MTRLDGARHKLQAQSAKATTALLGRLLARQLREPEKLSQMERYSSSLRMVILEATAFIFQSLLCKGATEEVFARWIF